MIYLDNAATTMPLPRAMEEFINCGYGNPSSQYSVGRRVSKKIEEARAVIASCLNAEPKNIIFTSSGSEANTLAILGMKRYLKSIGKKHLITSGYEHKSVLKCFQELESEGFNVTYLTPSETGLISADSVMTAITNNTGLVSIMLVNNELGTVNNIKKIAEVCHKKGVLLHTDCVQAFGCMNLSVKELKADLISISGHKVHAPKGTGALYAARPEILNAVIKGGDQEYGLRGGTHNAPAICAFALAAKEECEHIPENLVAYDGFYRYLRKELISGLDNARINCEKTPFRTSKIMSVTFFGVDSETLMLLLDKNHVAVSNGSACNVTNVGVSHVLEAIGMPRDEIKSTIRISFSRFTTSDEIESAAKEIILAVKTLRG